MAKTNLLLYTHPDCQDHIRESDHPEQSARLSHIINGIKKEPTISLEERDARPAMDDELLLAHTPEMIDHIFSHVPQDGIINIDADTMMSSSSGIAARRAAGSTIDAVDAICEGPITTAFCAVRPPGHHATPKAPKGFCLFNNVALAALHALNRDDIKRVAIFDFDVHHGNGTQDIFWDNPNVMFASIHQSPLFPYSGEANETGAHNNILNRPIGAQTEGEEWLSIIKNDMLPALTAFNADILLVSTGFDVHEDDPLASLSIRDDDFEDLGKLLRDFTKTNCQNRILFTLEGGYDLTALSRAPARMLKGLLQ